MPDISAALLLLKKPIEALAKVAAERFRNDLEAIKADAKIKTLYQKLSATQKIKTIWDVDKPRSLSSFYYPAKIRTKEGAHQQLSSIDELPANAIILSGTAGQGKSILLRHLLGKEIRSGERIPLFIELRKVPLHGLDAFLRETFFNLLDAKTNNNLFNLFAEQGKISFLLDGFDEVDVDRASDFIQSIETIALKFPNSRIIVTSRPSSGIETSPLFEVVYIAPLTNSDYPGFFTKILHRDKVLADSITNAVKNSAAVKAVASTPLLATLLTIVYRSTQKIPSDFSEFYDQLFQILLVRHDRAKAYTRRRKTTLGDREIQEGFEAFCFKSHADDKSVLTKLRALEICKESLKIRELICKEDDFLSDVVKVTCLLQEDGSNIEFVHQSVREFYAAKYITSRPTSVAEKFYKKLIADGRWRRWDQVTKFLSQLDRYRINQYYHVPLIKRALRSCHSEVTVAAAPRLREYLSDKCGVRKVTQDGSSKGANKYYAFVNFSDDLPQLSLFNQLIYDFFFGSTGIAWNIWRSAFNENILTESKSYTEIALCCNKIRELDEFLVTFVQDLRGELDEIEKSQSVIDSSNEFMDL